MWLNNQDFLKQIIFMSRLPKFTHLRPSFRPQYLVPLAGVLVTIALVALVPLPVYAQGLKDTLYDFLANIFLAFAFIIGHIATTFIGILVQIVQYNDFITAPAVVKGWVVVRDVANMFFIVILLVIAFGSVFRLEEYQYKNHLSKLLIMAVLINFSRSIAGFMIDFAQVIMLTFVNGFKDAAAGNFITGFHLDQMFHLAENASTGQVGASGLDFLAASVLALVTITIATVVVGVYIVVFTLRIVMLWLLIIISPLAYLLAGFPGEAKKYSSQWWDYFGKYVSSGPILAFFLWLSLAVMQLSSGALGDFSTKVTGNTDLGFSSIPAATITGIGQSEVLLSFIISIMLLMGGLWLTQQLGVAGGKLAGSAFQSLQKAGGAIGKGAFRGVTAPVRSVGKNIGYKTGLSALNTMARVPLVGNWAIRQRSLLEGKRHHAAEESTKGMEHITDEHASLLQERFAKKSTSKWRKWMVGEKEGGRAKYAEKWQAQKGQDLMGPKARKKYADAAIQDDIVNKSERGLKELGKKATATYDNVDGEPQNIDLNELPTRVTDAKQSVKNAEYDRDNFTKIEEPKLVEAIGELRATMVKLDADMVASKAKVGDITKEMSSVEADTTLTPDAKKLKLADLQTDLVAEQDNYKILNNKRRDTGGEVNKTVKEQKERNTETADRVTKTKKVVVSLEKAEVDAKATLPAVDLNQLNVLTNQRDSAQTKADTLNQEALKLNKAFWKHVFGVFDHEAHRIKTVGNNDTYTDTELGAAQERIKFAHPDLLDESIKRTVNDPALPSERRGKITPFEETDNQYYSQRLGTDLLRQASRSSLGDTHFIEQVVSPMLTRLERNMQSLGITMKADGALVNRQGKVMEPREMFQVFNSAFSSLSSVLMNAPVKDAELIQKGLDKIAEKMKSGAFGTKMKVLVEFNDPFVKSFRGQNRLM